LYNIVQVVITSNTTRKGGISMNTVTVRGNTLKIVTPVRPTVNTTSIPIYSTSAEEVRNAYQFTVDNELMKSWYCW
jgi:hypothetical protein